MRRHSATQKNTMSTQYASISVCKRRHVVKTYVADGQENRGHSALLHRQCAHLFGSLVGAIATRAVSTKVHIAVSTPTEFVTQAAQRTTPRCSASGLTKSVAMKPGEQELTLSFGYLPQQRSLCTHTPQHANGKLEAGTAVKRGIEATPHPLFGDEHGHAIEGRFADSVRRLREPSVLQPCAQITKSQRPHMHTATTMSFHVPRHVATQG